MTFVKICGLTQPADAELALQLGASHLGCVVAPDSPRASTWAARRAIRELARGRAAFVLVVRGLEAAAVQALAKDCEPEFVQWHGLDAAAEAAVATVLPAPLMRVRRLEPGAAALPPTSAAPGSPIVLDGGRGGAGTRFDWRLLAGGSPEHVFVAGGIDPGNVGELLAFSPWGVDVSSGIESAPGRKDHGAMRALFGVPGLGEQEVVR
ncbi:MAG: phosphoribosylanthranilate isomerase [bacterium]|nr:phosphoribosylanthranilate isomerase [bacterium]